MTQTELNTGLEQGEDKSQAPRQSWIPHLAILVAYAAKLLIGYFDLLSFLREILRGTGCCADSGNHYLMPAVYAFRIWQVIYASEGLFVAFIAWQLISQLQQPHSAPEKRYSTIKAVAPWYCVLIAVVVSWSFNLGWVGAAILTVWAVLLVVIHGYVAAFSELTSFPDFYAMNFPFSVYLGWVTAATLVTWDGVITAATDSVGIRVALLLAELALTTGFGCFLAFKRRSWVLPWSLAWAVISVGVNILRPRNAEMLEQWNSELGEVGRYALAVLVLSLGLLLVIVGVLGARKAQDSRNIVA